MTTNNKDRDPFNGTPVKNRSDMEVAHYDQVTDTQYYKDLETGDLFYYSPKTGGRVNA